MYVKVLKYRNYYLCATYVQPMCNSAAQPVCPVCPSSPKPIPDSAPSLSRTSLAMSDERR